MGVSRPFRSTTTRSSASLRVLVVALWSRGTDMPEENDENTVLDWELDDETLESE
jgi:hypothetical protein